MADPAPQRMETAVRQFWSEQGGADWEEVINHPLGGDSGHNAPNAMHRVIAEAAAQAGKPLGRTPDDTVDIPSLV